MMRWYAVYTKPHLEVWARNNLAERQVEVYLPQYLKRRRHARRTDIVAAPLFPRYLFVRADFDAGHRRRIGAAPGVAHLVTFGDRPAVVTDAVIAEIRAREEDDGYVRLGQGKTFRPGDRVKIADGALSDHTGLFAAPTDGDRVIVLLDLLGRMTRVQVPAGSVVSGDI
jgi:transcriptional antiterminator RfaH